MWPFRRKKREARGSNWLTFADVFGGVVTAAGIDVSEANASSLPAVWRCATLNADTISTTPLDVRIKRGSSEQSDAYPVPAWLRQPNDRQDIQQLLHEGQLSYEYNGNVFLLKAVDSGGRLAGLEVLDPAAVEPKLMEIGGQPRKVYEISAGGGKEIIAGTSVIHISGAVFPRCLRGMSPITQVLFETIGTGKAAQQFAAQYFGNGATLSGVIETPGMLTEEQVNRLRDDFRKRHGGISKSHAIGILSGGAAFKPLAVNAEESQFLETRRYTDVQVAGVFGVPPEYVTEAEGAKGYVTGLYMRQSLWLLTGLNPRFVRWENALSALLPAGAYVKFNRNAILIMSPQERAQFYAAAQRGEWMSVDEIRALEDRNPYGGEYARPLKSVQWVHGDEPPPEDRTDNSDQARSVGPFSCPEVGG